MDCSTPAFPILHYLPEFAQTHVHGVIDAIQPSHFLSPPSPPAFNLSQHRGFSNESALSIRWPNIGVSASVSVLPMNIQGWFPLGCTGLILQSQGLSRVFFSTTVQKPQFSDPALTFFMVQLLHLYVNTGKTIALSMQTFISRVMFLLLQRPNYKFTHRFSTAWRIGAPTLALSKGQLYYTKDKQENRRFEQCYKPNRPNSTPRQQKTHFFSSVQETFPQKNHIYKTKQVSVNLKTLLIWSIFSDQNEIN